MESKTKETRPRNNQKKNRKNTKNSSKTMLLIIVFIILVIAIILLGKHLNNKGQDLPDSKEIHEDVNLSSKEKSYYDLLLATMNKHEDLVTGAENVYFNLYDLPGLTHDEKENVAKKVLHSFAIHKDKELLIDTFDGLFFRGILDQETSELKDGIYVTFEDPKKDKDAKEARFAISIYKNSNENPKIEYDVKLADDKRIISFTKVNSEKSE